MRIGHLIASASEKRYALDILVPGGFDPLMLGCQRFSSTSDGLAQHVECMLSSMCSFEELSCNSSPMRSSRATTAGAL